MHERFWSDDLIDVSAGRVVRTKDEFLQIVKESDAKAAGPSKAGKPAVTCGADEVRIRPFGGIAVLDCRLEQYTAGELSR